MQNPINTLRLRRAIYVWLALAPIAALLPAAGRDALGMLVHPAFWCGLLPLLALGPALIATLREWIGAQRESPRRRTRRQASRRLRRPLEERLPPQSLLEAA